MQYETSYEEYLIEIQDVDGKKTIYGPVMWIGNAEHFLGQVGFVQNPSSRAFWRRGEEVARIKSAMLSSAQKKGILPAIHIPQAIGSQVYT